MQHTAVMLAEALDGLALKPDGTYVDGTFGRGGHSAAILQRLGCNGRLLALDRDWDAVQSQRAEEMRKDARFELLQARFSQMRELVVERNWLGRIDGIILDVGVSSPQLDESRRGFSFLQDGPLDMRMDVRSSISAAEWLGRAGEQDIAKVLTEYGEERFAKRIAAAIVKQRVLTPLATTGQLAALIEQAVPFREKHKHPATRSFQAIRIFVNGELEELQQGLEQAVDILRPGGRLVVIAFHSLEDRIVKRFFRDQSGGAYRAGKLPLRQFEANQAKLQKIGKAMQPGAAEIESNPRARSAVLRIAERI